MSKVFVVLNPRAGRGAAGKRRAELERLLMLSGIDYTLTPTWAAGAGIALAQRAAAEGYGTVAAIGGDGTISEVANGILLAAQEGLAPPRLAPIPFGTGNDFVKMFDGIAPGDLPGAVERLGRGHVRRIDAGRVNGRFFVNVVGMGIDAQVTIESLKVPALRGFAVYLAGVVRALAVYKPGPMIVSYDEVTLSGPALFLNVGNGRSHGGAFKLTPNARNDDGLLDLCYVRQMPLAAIIRHFPKVLSGTHAVLPEVTMGRTTRITVSCPGGAPLAADGEVLAADARQATIEVLPGALEVVC